MWGDTIRITQIISNLVSNAVKFTHKGSVTITVEIIDTNQEYANIILLIHHNEIIYPFIASYVFFIKIQFLGAALNSPNPAKYHLLQSHFLSSLPAIHKYNLHSPTITIISKMMIIIIITTLLIQTMLVIAKKSNDMQRKTLLKIYQTIPSGPVYDVVLDSKIRRSSPPSKTLVFLQIQPIRQMIQIRQIRIQFRIIFRTLRIHRTRIFRVNHRRQRSEQEILARIGRCGEQV